MLYITALFFLHQEHVQILFALLPRPQTTRALCYINGFRHRCPEMQNSQPARLSSLTSAPLHRRSARLPASPSPRQTALLCLPQPRSSFPACGRSASALGLVPAWAGEGLIPRAASLRWSRSQKSAVGSSSSHPPPAPEERLMTPALARKCHRPESSTARGYETLQRTG